VNAVAEPVAAGIHQMPAARYHADPADEPSLSNSILKVLLSKCPLHAWLQHPRLNPAFVPRADKEAFDLGTAAHSLLLEGIDKATMCPFNDWKTNAAKDARAAARKAGKIPMLPGQYEATLTMVEAAQRFIESGPLRGLLQRAKAEHSMVWRDEQFRINCRARLDLLDMKPPGSLPAPVIYDYKTTSAENPGDFIRGMVGNGYDTQAEFYTQGLAALGHPGARFVFIVQETAAPFLCYLVEPSNVMRDLGLAKITRGMRLWADCLRSNRWPGYPPDVFQADPLPWHIRDEETMT
jgi:hypothetical protein